MEFAVDLGVGVAFLAGLLSFLSPCVLPLVPAYIGYLSGAAVSDREPSRLWTASNAAAFVFGFGLVFVALGSLAGLAGSLAAMENAPLAFLGRLATAVGGLLPWLSRGGGVLLIVLGLHLTGLVRIPLLYRELRLDGGRPRRSGLFASVLVGMVFAAGWTPCVGPYLMSILILAGSAGTAGRGAFLLAVYTLGLGLPFLLAGLAVQAVAEHLRRLNRYLGLVSIVGGVLLIAMGILLVSGRLGWLNMMLASLWQPPMG